MSESLSDIEVKIIEICKDCLNVKTNLVEKNQGQFRCYIGGGRQFHPNDEKPYSRTIYLGSDSKRYDHVPEEIIDLNEVYFIFKRNYNLADWEDHPYHPSFDEAIKNLFKLDYFFVLELKEIMNETFHSQSYTSEWEKFEQPGKILRFVRLNPDKKG